MENKKTKTRRHVVNSSSATLPEITIMTAIEKIFRELEEQTINIRIQQGDIYLDSRVSILGADHSDVGISFPGKDRCMFRDGKHERRLAYKDISGIGIDAATNAITLYIQNSAIDADLCSCR